MDTITVKRADLNWGKNLHPADGEGRDGTQGIDATYTFDMVKDA